MNKVKKYKYLYLKDVNSDRIRITNTGRDLLSNKFARVGIDINRITTRESFCKALDASFSFEIQYLASQIKDSDPIKK